MAKGKKRNKSSIKEEKKKKNIIEKNRRNNKSCPKDLTLITNHLKKIERQKRLIPLKSLNIKPKKQISLMNIEEMKEFASEFDLNQSINYLILKYLKENCHEDYNKYIKKYKYTLDFKDALILNCFEKEKINLIKNEFNQNIKKFDLQLKGVNNIDSLSKLKLFNLFFFLLNEEIMDLKIISKKIISYSNDITLIFKVPNDFGNNELKFYSFINIFISFFILEDENINNNIINNDFISFSEEQIYFNWNSKIRGVKEIIDMTEFYDRKERLDENLKNNIEIKRYKNIVKQDKKLKQNYDIYNNISKKLTYFLIFKENIIEMVNEKEEKILEKIKFIYQRLLFSKDNIYNKLKIYKECLREKPYSQKEINSKKRLLKSCLEEDKECEKNSYKNFAIENIDDNYKNSINNPFYYNAKYYSFPTLLEKNILKNDKEIYEAFLKYLKHIYSSNIIKDIFYLSPEFNDFLYPLEDNEIFKEIIEYTNFFPIYGKILHEYTQKGIPDIIIPVNLEYEVPEEIHISKIVCDLSMIVSTCIHEQLKHYLKSLIFYNSFRFNVSMKYNNELYNYDEENKYINGILTRTHNQGNYSKIDCGDKAEIYLFGKILDFIYFPQAFELFKKSNWDKEIIEFIDNFNKSKPKKENTLVLSIKQINTNDDLCEFIKIFLNKFMKSVNNEEFIEFQNFTSSYRRTIKKYNNYSLEQDNIIFQNNCYINIKRNYIFDASL